MTCSWWQTMMRNTKRRNSKIKLSSRREGSELLSLRISHLSGLAVHFLFSSSSFSAWIGFAVIRILSSDCGWSSELLRLYLESTVSRKIYFVKNYFSKSTMKSSIGLRRIHFDKRMIIRTALSSFFSSITWRQEVEHGTKQDQERNEMTGNEDWEEGTEMMRKERERDKKKPSTKKTLLKWIQYEEKK